MNTRTFRVADVREGLRIIKREVGDDAVILSTARQTDGTIELTVSVDDMVKESLSAPENEPMMMSAPAPAAPASEPAEYVAIRAMVSDLKGQIRSLTNEVRGMAPTAAMMPTNSSGQIEPDLMADIRLAVARVNDHGRHDTFAKSVGLLYDWLTRHGVWSQHVEELVAYAFGAAEAWEDEPAILHRLVKEQMEERIPTVNPLWASRTQGREVAVLMGATGVGKTTTAAKIAAHARVVGGKSVGIICADTFRIGAADQIRTYAELLDIPIRMVASSSELRSAVQAFGNMDLVLIDTMGRNPWMRASVDKADLGLETVSAALESLGVEATFHLCLSASTRVEDLMDSARSFDGVRPDALVFTKIDESRALGALYSVPHASGVPISHVCTGPLVPDHIEAPTGREITQWVYRGHHNSPERTQDSEALR